MNHSVQAEGFGVRLRPVRLEDAAFIVWLRNQAHAVGRIGDSAATATAQEEWIRKYFTRPDDYYWVIETAKGLPVGTYGLWDFIDNCAESGRWITRTDVPAAIPSAILGLDIAFGELGLAQLRVKTVSTNRVVLSLNRKFGMREIGLEKDSVAICGKMVDQYKFVLYPQDWARAREQLLPLARVAEKQVADWEAAELKKGQNR